MTDSVYRDEIIMHAKRPQNYGLSDDFDLETRGVNQFCGDSMTIRLKLCEDTIDGVSFESESCVISRAAASLCSEYIKGKARDEVWAMGGKEAEKLLGIELTATRKKCATLFLDTIKKAI